MRGRFIGKSTFLNRTASLPNSTVIRPCGYTMEVISDFTGAAVVANDGTSPLTEMNAVHQL